MNLRQRIKQYETMGMAKEPARRRAFIDAHFGDVEIDWDGETLPSVFIGLHERWFKPRICAWCNQPLVSRDDVSVQKTYWTPHSYKIGHTQCCETGHKKDVYLQQCIDQDCNECLHFTATEPVTKHGDRYGVCKRDGTSVTGHPGGEYCTYPLHEHCFKHRRKQD